MRLNKPIRLKLMVECRDCVKTWHINTDIKEGSPEQQKVTCPTCGKLAIPVRGDKSVAQP